MTVLILIFRFKNTSARGKEARRKHAQFKSEQDAVNQLTYRHTIAGERDVPTNVGAYTGMFDPSDDSKKTGELEHPYGSK